MPVRHAESRNVESWWRATVAGETPGLAGVLIRSALSLAQWPYLAAVSLRNELYDRGWRRVYSAGVPVVSVGNLTVGGTGKTPGVRWLANWLRERKRQPVILSRGYGRREPRELNDEALELARRLPGVVHLQDADRVAIARRAVRQHHADVLILDDGFQHRRLGRDVDLVLVDATCPFGFGHVLPRGMLREPIRSLRRADAVIVTRVDALDPSARDNLLSQIRRYRSDLPIAGVSERPQAWVDAAGRESSLPSIGPLLQPCCGIGNPRSFARTLESLGLETLPLEEFPDHHHYTDRDLQRIIDLARTRGASHIVCTEKDLVKIDRDRLGPFPLHALRIEWQWEFGLNAIESVISSRLA